MNAVAAWVVARWLYPLDGSSTACDRTTRTVLPSLPFSMCTRLWSEGSRNAPGDESDDTLACSRESKHAL